MNQLEIQFFWPLTEQIPLELDYANCEKPKFSTNTGGTFLCSPGGSYVLTTGTTSILTLLCRFRATSRTPILPKLGMVKWYFSMTH